MKTLHLNLEKRWFDMILSGQKRQEYREVTPYWIKILSNLKEKGIRTITFSNGYRKDRRQMIVRLEYISINEGILEWGAEEGKKYFVLHLGKVVSSNCEKPVKTRIIEQLRREAKEAEKDSETTQFRDDAFEASGMQYGLERAIEIVDAHDF